MMANRGPAGTVLLPIVKKRAATAGKVRWTKNDWRSWTGSSCPREPDKIRHALGAVQRIIYTGGLPATLAPAVPHRCGRTR